jgi:nucleotide-binding universal stress UspA family protein
VFERIIVALDGSESSEAALAAASEAARRLGSSLVLLHVLEKRPPKAIHGERHLATKAEAEAYLAPLAERLAAEGLRASYHVHDAADAGGSARGPEGSTAVARAVAEHEAEFGGELAIMAAHGRRGAASALSGSLPLKVASEGGAAVLIVPKGVFAPKRVVLPLDGRIDHESAIPAAAAFAAAFGVGIRLVAAVPRSASEGVGDEASIARLSPALSGACLEYTADAEESYLASIAARLASQGIATEALVLRGRPAKAIVAACEAGDLLALSSHRRLGLDASLDGCVAFEAARRWAGAMLVVPVPRGGQAPEA